MPWHILIMFEWELLVAPVRAVLSPRFTRQILLNLVGRVYSKRLVFNVIFTHVYCDVTPAVSELVVVYF